MKEYQETGVDIQGSNAVKKEIGKLAQTTYDKNVLAGVGSFGAMYDLTEIKKNCRKPVLVQSMDGVGTKLVIAKAMNSLSVCGRDLVNHCINDILPAKPIIFMDYIAQDRLREEEILQIIKGMISACREAGISLIGGETAQMPGTYKEGQFDIAGVMTGIIEKDQIIDGSKIKPGDKIIGLPSTGLHTNGYSLIRKIFFSQPAETSSEGEEEKGWSPYFCFKELGDQIGRILLQPHRSYLWPISLLLNNRCKIHGIAHITGGGLPDNIARILPENYQAQIRLGSWPISSIFPFIQREGHISIEEMYQVFNMGIGIVLIVSRETSKKIHKILWENKEACYTIGEITQGEEGVKFYSKDGS